MYSKNDLNEDLKQIWFLYTSAYEYYTCLRQIKEHSKTEYADSRFLFFIKYSCWYILVIELCKVYQNDNRNQHFNVYRLVNKLLNEYKNLEFKSLISLSDIKGFHASFISKEIIETRDRIVTLRDKFYAHTDRQDPKFIDEIIITLDEIECLFNILRDFIFDLKFKIFNSHAEFGNDIFVNMDKILRSLEDSNKRAHEEIIRNFNTGINKFR